MYLRLKKIFNKHGINIILDDNSAKMLGIDDGIKFDKLCKKCDFIVALGGDGTLISVARKSLSFNKPILGINLGRLGFLTDINPEELDDFLINMKKNRYRIDKRMMLEVSINNNKRFSFNDVAFCKDSSSGILLLDAKVDNGLINKYNGDGLIVSTPTGSTAYNLSCGGPVVYPLTNALIITPISAHSLTQRPLVLPEDFEVTISLPNKQKAILVIDGQDRFHIDQTDNISVKIASKKTKLIHRFEHNYFDVLSTKLNWGQS
ncbi:NAD kinase [hydrothermal vent metagenome]|uniref:NAD kinase n=1 Tax=hydrothermal vent metagenome TaxID=652676 RepID=A0A3B1EA00_9ZZZZ